MFTITHRAVSNVDRALCFRNIPLGLGISLLVVTVLYLLTNVAYFSVISPQEMIGSQAVVMVTNMVYNTIV